MHLQCIVLQLRGRQVGQGDLGQPAAVDALRQAASAPGRRYTADPPSHTGRSDITTLPILPPIIPDDQPDYPQSTSNITGTATTTQHHTTTAHCSPLIVTVLFVDRLALEGMTARKRENGQGRGVTEA